jgi:phosphohistidine swiveling domain-containing protein
MEAGRGVVDGVMGGSDAFPVTWEDPRDPERAWDRDDMHMPFPLAPLAQDYIRVLGLGFNLCYEIFGGFPQRIHCRIWNGYAYFAYESNLPKAEEAANRERWVAVNRERAEVTEAYWHDEVLPEVRELEAGIRVIPVATLGRAELAAAWDDVWASIGRMWQLHFNTILGPYMVVEDLADLYEKTFPGADPGEALVLVQGTHHEILETELGMERLAAIPAGYPALRAALVDAATGPADARRTLEPADVAAIDGGPELLGELEVFLARHGHMGQGVDDLALPSWAEDPSIVLGNLGTRLANPPEPAEPRRERLAAGAAALADRVRTALAGDPDELARFEELLRLARAIGPLTEVHNYWIDRMAQARLRGFVMRVAARLVADGSLERPEDVLYLHRPEVRELIEVPADRRALVGERRTEQARQRTLVVPKNVGADPGPAQPDRFEATQRESSDPDILLGTGASAGIVRGPARVALGPNDFGRIGPGDIIVCPSSNPSWVTVFTIASGLVTNTGGVLSHAAVVAREFGLPAVVGIAGATSSIADGRLVEIDGTKGSVRLL